MKGISGLAPWFLFVATLAGAENTVNPTKVQFAPSPDHDTLVTSYSLGVFTSAVSTMPVYEFDLGKPVPDATGTCEVPVNLASVGYGVGYVARIRALAGAQAGGWSTPSSPFDLAAVTTVTVSSVSVTPTTVPGTGSATGTVTLSGSAPTGGASVTLTSSVPAAAAVPASVIVPAGSTSATFTVTTFAVATTTAGTITASFGNSSSAAILAVAADSATPTSTVTTVAVTPNVTGPAAVGTPIAWTATAAGGTAPLQYAFWLSGPGPGWVVIQGYSPSNTLLWTPSAAGTYRIQVGVRNSGSTAAYDAVSSVLVFSVTASPPVVTDLSANVTLPAPVGLPTTWTATATGGTAPLEYAFWLSGPGPGWVVIQPYSTANTLLWTPRAAGTYRLQVGVRSKGSTTAYDAVSSVVVFAITAAPPVVTALSANVTLPARVGLPIAWTATAAGGTAPLQYAFWLSGPGPGWVVIQGYSPSNTLLWTPSAAGTYRIQVGVRNSGSTAAYDAVSVVLVFSIAEPLVSPPSRPR